MYLLKTHHFSIYIKTIIWYVIFFFTIFIRIIKFPILSHTLLEKKNYIHVLKIYMNINIHNFNFSLFIITVMQYQKLCLYFDKKTLFCSHDLQINFFFQRIIFVSQI